MRLAEQKGIWMNLCKAEKYLEISVRKILFSTCVLHRLSLRDFSEGHKAKVAIWKTYTCAEPCAQNPEDKYKSLEDMIPVLQ